MVLFLVRIYTKHSAIYKFVLVNTNLVNTNLQHNNQLNMYVFTTLLVSQNKIY